MPVNGTVRKIAPRLVSKERRQQMGNGLPPVVKDWIRMMAEREGKSASYWIEEQFLAHVVPTYLGRQVRYIPRKKAS